MQFNSPWKNFKLEEPDTNRWVLFHFANNLDSVGKRRELPESEPLSHEYISQFGCYLKTENIVAWMYIPKP